MADTDVSLPPPPHSSPPPAHAAASPSQMLRVEPPTSPPKRRLPELVLGIFLVAGCALAAVLVAAAGRERTPALALTDDIQRGETIEESDVETIYIGSDNDIAYLSPDDRDEIVGHAALTNLPAGSLITLDQFADSEAIAEQGDAQIGLQLEPGQLPSLDLAPGDKVMVVVGSAAGSTQAEPTVAAESATVESVSEIEGKSGQQASWWVSLRIDQSDATELAMATASNARVQLVMVER